MQYDESLGLSLSSASLEQKVCTECAIGARRHGQEGTLALPWHRQKGTLALPWHGLEGALPSMENLQD